MGREIERKFLVLPNYRPDVPPTPLVQGYLSASPQVTVRVRRAGSRYFLTIKGQTQGVSRAEYEYEIPEADGRELLELCPGRRVEKLRYRQPVGAHVFEVDVFSGDNAGLVLAEVELGSEDEEFERPEWLAEEVSSDPRYTNSALSRNPYGSW